jgi:hypothetical protein
VPFDHLEDTRGIKPQLLLVSSLVQSLLLEGMMGAIRYVNPSHYLTLLGLQSVERTQVGLDAHDPWGSGEALRKGAGITRATPQQRLFFGKRNQCQEVAATIKYSSL